MSSSLEPLDLGWIAPLAEREPRLQAVALWAAQLSPDVRQQLSAAAERLASVSPTLVEPFLLGARAVLARFGPAGLPRWWQMAFALASHARASRAAEYFLTLEPDAFGAGGLDAAQMWCTLGQRVSERSRHLGATYFAKTLPVLAADGGSERLRLWTEASLALLEREGWQAQLIVELSFANAPESVLATRAPSLWYELALALEPQHFVPSAPLGLSELSAEDQTKLLTAIKAAAEHDAQAACRLSTELPPILSALVVESRATLLDLITTLTAQPEPPTTIATDERSQQAELASYSVDHDAQVAPPAAISAERAAACDVEVASLAVHGRASAAEVVPLAAAAALGDAEDGPLSPWDEARGAMDALLMTGAPLDAPAARPPEAVDAVRVALRVLAAGVAELGRGMCAISELQLLAALRALLPVARASPEAAVAAMLVLPELFRHADAAGVTRWVEHGLAIGHERPAAAKAYFALESRSSRGALLAAASGVPLEPELGVWRKLLEMASGEPAVIRRTATLSLRPSLERDPTLGEVELPDLCDFLPKRDDNRAVLRFLTMQLAGRRQFGTYDHVVPQLPAATEQLFLVAEAIRIQQRLGQAYPGTIDETQQLAAKLLEAWRTEEPRTFARFCDALLALALAATTPLRPTAAKPSEPQRILQSAWSALPDTPDSPPTGSTSSAPARMLQSAWSPPPVAPDAPPKAASSGQPTPLTLPFWMPEGLARDFLALVPRLRVREATVLTALALTEQLVLLFERFALDAGPRLAAAGSGTTVGTSSTVALPEDASEARHARARTQGVGSGELVAQGEVASRTNGSHSLPGQAAAFPEQGTDSPPPSEPDGDHAPLGSVAVRRAQLQGVQSFVYDEWDHTIADYRAQHCRVQELPLTADSGVFFERTLHEARDLLSHVKRQFEQLRPERYRPLCGLEDGEDFDLNALTDARIAARGGQTPSTRIYTSRTRQARDVATLFLVDMSASTGQVSHNRRIIDTLKEALIVMTAALEKLGDQYAIYGFSSRGRERVEVYPVKTFREPLGHQAKARIGGIEPKSGTRMGTALRHMIPKFAAVNARSKHLILLSDGFPQDQDYGVDRRTHTYGIEDTAVALREVSAAGPLPFCVTVDRSGNDYLRLMCDPAQYLIIDDIAELPRELPKIYRRIASE